MTLPLIIMHHDTKFGFKWLSSDRWRRKKKKKWLSSTDVEMITTWWFEPLLWPWPGKMQSNFMHATQTCDDVSWHKASTVHKIRSEQEWTVIFWEVEPSLWPRPFQMTFQLMIMHHNIMFGCKWLNSSGNIQTKRKKKSERETQTQRERHTNTQRLKQKDKKADSNILP